MARMLVLPQALGPDSGQLEESDVKFDALKIGCLPDSLIYAVNPLHVSRRPIHGEWHESEHVAATDLSVLRRVCPSQHEVGCHDQSLHTTLSW